MQLNKVSLVMALTILVMGTGWIIVPYQFQELSVEVSLAIRFFLSSLFILAYDLIVNRKKQTDQNMFSYKLHMISMVQGTLMYALAYLFLYHSIEYVATGIVSIIVSLIVIPTTLIEKLFFKTKITRRFIFGIAVSALGICCLYYESIDFSDNNPLSALLGIFYILVAITFMGLSTNITKYIHDKTKISNLKITSLGMFYGALISIVYAALIGREFLLPTEISYYYSLLYLVFIVSPGALLAYMWLINHSGPSKASLIFIIAPIVAMNLSVVFEGLEWNQYTLSGNFLVLFGSYIALKKPPGIDKDSRSFLKV